MTVFVIDLNTACDADGRRGPFNRDLRVKSDVAQNLIDDFFSNFDCQKTFPYEEF